MSRSKPFKSIAIDLHTLAHTGDVLYPFRLQGFRKEALLNDKQRLYPGVDALSLDEWDETSLHVICVDGSRILGASRIVPLKNGKLPFEALAPKTDAKVRPTVGLGDTELSRYIVAPEYRSGLIMRALLVGTADGYIECRDDAEFVGNIWTDVLLGGPRMLNKRTYFKLGFVQEDIRVFDEAYNQISDVFFMKREDRLIFFNTIDGLRKRHVAGSRAALL